jgi:hypothetical protein
MDERDRVLGFDCGVEFYLIRMFNFGANHLFLLSRKEYRSCAVLLLLDLSGSDLLTGWKWNIRASARVGPTAAVASSPYRA